MSRLTKTVPPFAWTVITAQFQQGTASTFNLQSSLSNPQGKVITYSVATGALPNGVTLSGSVVSYNGTALASSANVAFRAATTGNVFTDSGTTAVSIIAPAPANTAPTWITAASLAALDSGATFSFPLIATDAQSDPITFSSAAAPFGSTAAQAQSGANRTLLWSGTAPTVAVDTLYTFLVDALDTQPVGQVTGLNATATSPSTVALTWSAVTGATLYTAERSLTGSSSWTAFTTTGTTYTDTGLLAATPYFYRVKASNGSIDGLYSATKTATTAPATALVHDGLPTPEQISLYMPSTAASATVRYRPVGGAYVTAHPLLKIIDAETSAVSTEAFAGVITGLTPGTTYEVEVTADGVLNTLTHTTRSLPAAAGAVTINIPAGSTSAQVQTLLNTAVPGSVVQFANGTYNLTGVLLTKSGTEAQPIYIRGQSRVGVTLHADTSRVLYVVGANYLVIENMTITGSGVDSGTASSSVGIQAFGDVDCTQLTVRNVTMTGVDVGVWCPGNPGVVRQALVYDNTITGNNLWDLAWLTTNTTPGGTLGNMTWNDDGIMLSGSGNCAFNNTLGGFGDAFSVYDNNPNTAIHFYRNRITFSCDDAVEIDYARRNFTFYDNHITNAMTAFSLDPITEGPCYIFRNVWVNLGRQTFKINSPTNGVFVYNNTVVREVGYPSTGYAGWPVIIDGPSGTHYNFAYRNNAFVWKGALGNAVNQIVRIEGAGWAKTDVTNNAWYPDGAFVWPSYESTSLAGIQALTDPKLPLYGTQKRHTADVIAEADPFATDVTLGATWDIKVTTLYTPTIDAASVLKGAGVAIATITDGYSGAAPDIGAVITGRTLPTWGDRS